MIREIHFIWFQGIAEAPVELRKVPERWQALNPGYNIRIWDEPSLFWFLKEKYPAMVDFYSRIGDGETANIRTIKKCDFVRLLLLHHFGGWYFDLDCLPLHPLSSLLQSGGVMHRHTEFTYGEYPTVLPPAQLTPVDFESYELILTREHLPNIDLGGHSVANSAIYAAPGSDLLLNLVHAIMLKGRENVLSFAGPHAFSRFLLDNLSDAKGKVLCLPPFYFLWQEWDMGKAWEHTVCLHMNRMDWGDKTRSTPWDI